MGNSWQTMNIPHRYEIAFKIVINALVGLGNCSINAADAENGIIHARTSLSWRSWGENLDVVLSSNETDETEVEISSVSAHPLNIADGKVNDENVEKIVRNINRLSSLQTVQKQEDHPAGMVPQGQDTLSGPNVRTPASQVVCGDCGTWVDRNAKSCSKCGAPIKQNANSSLISAGYACAILALFFIPFLLGFIGFVIGIINIAKDNVQHGIAQMILSFICGLIGTFIGFMTAFS